MPRGKPLNLPELRKEITLTEKVLMNLRRKEQRLLEREKEKSLKEVEDLMEMSGINLEELINFIENE